MPRSPRSSAAAWPTSASAWNGRRRHFKLDFIPLATERYFAMCRRDALARPEIEQVLAILRSDAFRAEVDALPGYQARDCGSVHVLADVLAAAGIVS